MAPRIKAKFFLIVVLIGLFILAGCGSNPTPQPTAISPSIQSTSTENVNVVTPVTEPTPASDSEQTVQNGDDSYPGVSAIPTYAPAYPVEKPSILLTAVPEPPNPERTVPEANQDSGVIAGVLIQEVIEDSFVPLQARGILLGEVLLTDTGEPAYVRANEASISAQLFETGIFVFNEVPAGTYGLVVDLQYTEFLVNDESGNPILITVEAGQAIDLGQVITEIPK